jgi:GT2 family glycosyltransferase/peptidoglycan hydrolase CwlO-like protein
MLEHEELMKEVKRLLKGDGIFIVSTPNKKAYSDDVNYKNPFHEKELYFDDFKELLKSNFNYVYFFGQRVYAGSHLWSLTRIDEISEEYVIERRNKGFVVTDYEKKEPMYFIAITSDKEIDISKHALRSYLTDADNTVFDNFRGYIHGLEGEVADVRNAIAEKDERVRELEASLEDRNQHIQSLKGEVAEIRNAIAEKDERVRELEASLEDRNQHIQSLEGEVAEIRNAIAEKDERVRELEASLEDRNQHIQSLEGEVAEIRNAIAQKDDRLREFEVSLEDRNQHIQRLEGEVAEVRNTIAQKDERIREIEMENLRINTELNSMKSSVTWRTVMKWHSLVEKLMPPMTRRRRWYDLGTTGLRTIANEGWRSFWWVAKEGLKKYIPFRIMIRISYLLVKLHEITALRKNRKRIKNNLNPMIDIIVPVYNHGKYLQQCIESAINQTYEDINLLIVDDCSTDPLVFKILEKYKDHPKIKMYFHHKNQGISKTLNDAIIRASGDYLAFLDCDDLLVPNAIEKVVGFVRNNRDVYFIYSDRININENGEVVEYVSFKNRGTDAKKELLKGMYTSHLKVIKKECFLKVGLFSHEYDFAQDYDLSLRISEKFNFGYINDSLYKHRVHKNQVTQKNLKKQENIAKLIKNAAIQRRTILDGKLKKLTSIVMLTFNRLEDTKRSIESIYKYTKLPFELIILDNNSEAKVREYISWLEKNKSNVEVIFENENLGCSGGRKKAVKSARGEYIVTLDNDICVTSEWLENLIIRIEEDKKIAAACANVVFPNGKIQYTGGELKVENDFVKFSLIDGNKNENDLSSFIERDCDWIPGGAMIIKREFFEKVEHRDEIKGAYEDNDYALQIRNVGGRLVNCPLAKVVHYHLQFGTNVFKDKRYLNGRYNNEKMMEALVAFYKYNRLIIKDDDLYNMLKISNKSDKEIRQLITNSLHAR